MTASHRHSYSLGQFPILALAVVLAPQAMAMDPAAKTWKTSTAAHLRAGPSGQSPVVASVPKEALLTSSQPCARSWCAVEYKGVRGWIYNVFLVEEGVKPAPQMPPPPQPLAKASLETTIPAPVHNVDAPRDDTRPFYHVVGLKADESLPLREGPLEKARVVGTLSFGATAIARLEPCQRPWCLVEHNGLRGYIPSRFVGRLETPSRKFGISGETGVQVMSFAGPGADVVGEIPFYAGGIVPIGECNKDWCHIRYLGLVGFVDARRLRPDNPPSGLASSRR